MTCSVPTCTNPAHARGWCRTHYNRWWKHGDVQADNPPRIGAPRVPNPTYITVHARLRRERGPAKLHTCAHCQQRSAQHWAYNHTDPAPRIDRVGCPYSADLDRYIPLCAPCHDRFDRFQTPGGVGETGTTGEPWAEVPAQSLSVTSI